MLKYNLLFLLSLLFSCSDTDTEQTEIINIDFKEVHSFPSLDSIECKFIPLETNEKCLISGIKQIEFIDDKIYLIDNHLEKVLLFDTLGNFITQIGNRGSGPGEYIMPGSFYVGDKNINIVDYRQNKLLFYDSKTYKYISSKKTFNTSDCAWLAMDTIAWFNMAGYNNGKRNHFHISISDSKLNNLTSFLSAKFKPSYTIRTGNNFYQHEGQIYLSIQFSSIVYRITSKSAIPVYNISFGKDLLPSEEWLSNHIIKDENYLNELIKSQYISAYNLGETKEYIGTTYYAHGQKFYIAFFNKTTKRSYKCNAYDFMKKYNLYGMSPIKGTHNDYFITSLNMSDLKKYPILSDRLRSIVDKSSEEDNPIICLFKFK